MEVWITRYTSSYNTCAKNLINYMATSRGLSPGHPAPKPSACKPPHQSNSYAVKISNMFKLMAATLPAQRFVISTSPSESCSPESDGFLLSPASDANIDTSSGTTNMALISLLKTREYSPSKRLYVCGQRDVNGLT